MSGTIQLILLKVLLPVVGALAVVPAVAYEFYDKPAAVLAGIVCIVLGGVFGVGVGSGKLWPGSDDPTPKVLYTLAGVFFIIFAGGGGLILKYCPPPKVSVPPAMVGILDQAALLTCPDYTGRIISEQDRGTISPPEVKSCLEKEDVVAYKPTSRPRLTWEKFLKKKGQTRSYFPQLERTRKRIKQTAGREYYVSFQNVVQRLSKRSEWKLESLRKNLAKHFQTEYPDLAAEWDLDFPSEENRGNIKKVLAKNLWFYGLKYRDRDIPTPSDYASGLQSVLNKVNNDIAYAESTEYDSKSVNRHASETLATLLENNTDVAQNLKKNDIAFDRTRTALVLRLPFLPGVQTDSLKQEIEKYYFGKHRSKILQILEPLVNSQSAFVDVEKAQSKLREEKVYLCQGEEMAKRTGLEGLGVFGESKKRKLQNWLKEAFALQESQNKGKASYTFKKLSLLELTERWINQEAIGNLPDLIHKYAVSREIYNNIPLREEFNLDSWNAFYEQIQKELLGPGPGSIQRITELTPEDRKNNLNILNDLRGEQYYKPIAPEEEPLGQKLFKAASNWAIAQAEENLNQVKNLDADEVRGKWNRTKATTTYKEYQRKDYDPESDLLQKLYEMTRKRLCLLRSSALVNNMFCRNELRADAVKLINEQFVSSNEGDKGLFTGRFGSDVVKELEKLFFQRSIMGTNMEIAAYSDKLSDVYEGGIGEDKQPERFKDSRWILQEVNLDSIANSDRVISSVKETAVNVAQDHRKMWRIWQEISPYARVCAVNDYGYATFFTELLGDDGLSFGEKEETMNVNPPLTSDVAMHYKMEVGHSITSVLGTIKKGEVDLDVPPGTLGLIKKFIDDYGVAGKGSGKGDYISRRFREDASRSIMINVLESGGDWRDYCQNFEKITKTEN